jgi:uncharacterized delta-60 repeat protein
MGAGASPEDRDPSFDGDGRVVTDFSSAPEEPRNDRVNDVVIHPDGKIVVGGYTHVGDSSDFALARYNSDGSLDTSFDTDGKVTTDIPGQHNRLEALAAQSDGKVVAVGGDEWDDKPWMLRNNADGSLDESFGVEGKVALDLPDPWADVAYVADVAIQEDGKIVVAGTADGFEQFALARYNPDGSPDTTFSGDGSINVRPASSDEFDVARGVAVQPNGKIVVAIGGYYGAVLRRFEVDGTPDRTFGEGGTVENPDVPSYKDVIIQEDGKIVSQNYKNLARRMWGVTKYNRDGSVDRSFAFYYGWGRDQYPGASAMAAQPDGKIVLAGSLRGGDGLHDFALTRHLGAAFQDDTKPTRIRSPRHARAARQ